MRFYFLLFLWLSSLFVFGYPISAEPGFHGEAGFKYNIDGDPGELWTIDLRYGFTDSWSIGVMESTWTDGYATYFDSIPAFTPSNQLYEVYLMYEWDYNKAKDSLHLSIKLSQWCNHPVYSNQAIKDTVHEGLYLECKVQW